MPHIDLLCTVTVAVCLLRVSRSFYIACLVTRFGTCCVLSPDRRIKWRQKYCALLRELIKIAKSKFSFMNVALSVRMEQVGFHWTDSCETAYRFIYWSMSTRLKFDYIETKITLYVKTYLPTVKILSCCLRDKCTKYRYAMSIQNGTV
jgi:hypothetical protein